MDKKVRNDLRILSVEAEETATKLINALDQLMFSYEAYIDLTRNFILYVYIKTTDKYMRRMEIRVRSDGSILVGEFDISARNQPTTICVASSNNTLKDMTLMPSNIFLRILAYVEDDRFNLSEIQNEYENGKHKRYSSPQKIDSLIHYLFIIITKDRKKYMMNNYVCVLSYKKGVDLVIDFGTMITIEHNNELDLFDMLFRFLDLTYDRKVLSGGNEFLTDNEVEKLLHWHDPVTDSAIYLTNWEVKYGELL